MFTDTELWLKQVYLQNTIGVAIFIALLLFAFFGPNSSPKKQQGQLIWWWHDIETGLILDLRLANERRRYKVTPFSHWMGANLESAL